MKGIDMRVSAGFLPRFCSKGRVGVRFQMVIYTRHRNGAQQCKTLFPHETISEEQCKQLGYDTDRLVRRALEAKGWRVKSV